MIDAVLLASIEAARAIVTSYAVYAIIIGSAGIFCKIKTTWLERVEAIGGVLWVVGVSLWRTVPESSGYDIDLMLRSSGVALILLPRVILIAKRAFAATPASDVQ